MGGSVSKQLLVRPGGFKGFDQVSDAHGVRSGQDLPSSLRNLRKPREFDQYDTRFLQKVRLPADSSRIRENLVCPRSQLEKGHVPHRFAKFDLRALKHLQNSEILQ